MKFIKTRRSVSDYKEDPISFHNAPLLVIILGNKKSVTADWDCAMAAQNMMLAAHSKCIGSCWIEPAMPTLMDEKILKELGAPPVIKRLPR